MYKKVKKEKTEKKEKINLEEAIAEIRDSFGEGAIMKLSDVRKVDVDVIPTGSLTTDLALGVMGVPRGRIIEIYGGESAGKTTLSLSIIAEAQKKGGVAAFIDAEHALDPEYAKRIGVNLNDLLIAQPDSGEQALQIVEKLVRSEDVDVIVIDSVAALVPKAEVAGEVGDQQIGLQARLMSQALRKLSSIIAKTNTIVIFLNQTRMKIGIMFGNPETTPGGVALKFYASVRLELRRIAQIKQGESVVGSRIKVKVVKNKVAAPFQTAEFDIYYAEGISKESELINLAAKEAVITKAGAHYSFGDMKLGNGVEASKLFLKENPKVYEDLKKAVIKKIKEEDSPKEDKKKEKEE